MGKTHNTINYLAEQDIYVTKYPVIVNCSELSEIAAAVSVLWLSGVGDVQAVHMGDCSSLPKAGRFFFDIVKRQMLQKPSVNQSLKQAFLCTSTDCWGLCFLELLVITFSFCVCVSQTRFLQSAQTTEDDSWKDGCYWQPKMLMHCQTLLWSRPPAGWA